METVLLNASSAPGVTAVTLNLTIGQHDPFHSSMGDTWDMIIGMTILVIVITGIMLNVIVLWTLVKHRSRQGHNHQQTTTDYYIIALATSDLLAVVLCYPLTFVSTVSHQWLFGDIGCAVNGFFGFLFSTVDIGVLATMSIVRMLSVKMPHCALVREHRYTGVTLVVAVIYALIWTAAPLFGWGEYAPEPFGTSCTVAWKNPDRSYVTAIFTGVLAVPLVIMFVSYGCVVYHMSLSTSRVERYFAERKRRAKKQNRLVRMAVLMCVCFLIIWLPYSVLSICFAYIPDFDVHPVQSAIPTVLAKMSHVINPVIYFTMNPYYRRRVKCLPCCRTVASPASKTTTGGKFTEECPAERSSDQVTQLPMSTYITPSPSAPHCAHATQRSDAPSRRSVSITSSVVPMSDDYDSNNDAASASLDDGQEEVQAVSFSDLSKNNLRNIILTLEKGSRDEERSHEGGRKNDLLNDDVPNNVSKSGAKSASRIKFILDTRNFQRLHSETVAKKSEADYITYNDLGGCGSPVNRISELGSAIVGAKLGFHSNNSNLAANLGYLHDVAVGDSSPVREKVVKKLVGVALTTQGKGEINLNTNAQSYSESWPLESSYLPCKEVAMATYCGVHDKNRFVKCLGFKDKMDAMTDQNENVESYLCMCPRDVDQMFAEDSPFMNQCPTNV